MNGDFVLIVLPGVGTLRLARDEYKAALQPAEIPVPPVLQPCEELVTAKRLATRLSLPLSCIYEHAKAGRIPCIKVGRHVRFNVEAVLTQLRLRNLDETSR